MSRRLSHVVALCVCAVLITGTLWAQQAGSSPPPDPRIEGHHEVPHDAYVPAPSPRTTTPGAAIYQWPL